MPLYSLHVSFAPQADGKFRIPMRAIESVTKHRIGLKGPLATREKDDFASGSISNSSLF